LSDSQFLLAHRLEDSSATDICNPGRFGNGIGESIHVILVCLDPIIFPCCMCKENTRAPSNTPLVVVLGVADPPRRHQAARVLGCAGAIRSRARRDCLYDGDERCSWHSSLAGAFGRDSRGATKARSVFPHGRGCCASSRACLAQCIGPVLTEPVSGAVPSHFAVFLSR